MDEKLGLSLPVVSEGPVPTYEDLDKALDTTVDLVTLRALNRSTTYAELPEGIAFSEAAILGPSGFSCVEALVNAGSGSLIVNAATKIGTETRFA